MEYLEELYDRRLRERSDEGIAHEKYALAVGAAPELLEFLRKSIHTKVEKFKELFPGERIELRQPATDGSTIRVRTNRFPLRVVDLSFKKDGLTYVKRHQRSRDSQTEIDTGTVYIRADFVRSAYFEYQGKPILDDDLATEMLRELFEDASC